MRLDFFSQLSREEALAYLSRYREVEAGAFEETRRAAAPEGVTTDFSVASVPAFFLWLIGRVGTVVLPDDPTVPEWIRSSSSYARGRVGFDEQSRPIVLRASWYLGESFVRAFPHLSWNVGDPEFEAAHQPVVAGFADERELAPIMVTENVLLRVLGGAPPTVFDRAVELWAEDAYGSQPRAGP